MNTPAQRASAARHHKALMEAGKKRLTVWLSAEAQAALDALAKRFGSRNAALEAVLTSQASDFPDNPDKS